MHNTDTDCAATLDHSDHCTECGGRAFHTATCPTMIDTCNCAACSKPEDKCRDCKVRT